MVRPRTAILHKRMEKLGHDGGASADRPIATGSAKMVNGAACVCYQNALASGCARRESAHTRLCSDQQDLRIMPHGATHDLAARPEAAVTSSIGRRVALRLGIAFVDADAEIEKAAGMSVSDIFAIRGEAEFRAGEARVIARLLEGGPQVLATGGGAFAN